MNDSFVLDSSVAIAWVVRSQSTLILCRRRIIQADQHAKACEQLGDLDLVIDEQGPRLAFGETSRLAKLHFLSAYDAVYLELALRRGLPLASRDAALNKAARRAGIRTLL